MHDHLHYLKDECAPGLQGLDKDHWWEFEAYLDHWLSALFVLVEGFNKLKIRDVEVQRLSGAHVGILKRVRHKTYHFTLSPQSDDLTLHMYERLNWAEDLS